MIDIRTNKKLCSAFIWFTAACALVILMTSCSPYAATEQLFSTPTPAPSMTAEKVTTLLPSTPAPPACTVTAYTLNLRSGPGTRHAVTQILYSGEAVTVLSLRKDNWLKIETAAGVRGWVYSRYCQEANKQ
jgi:uncharacterized protein YgiM (DUF1202 family)